jgi:hypothetical protein
VDDFFYFLKKFKINPIKAVDYRNPDEYISNKVSTLIINSNCFVGIITQNSINNQWVNQELGFTYATQKIHELGQQSGMYKFTHLIPIYRLIDVSIRNNIKGFSIGKEDIDLDINNLPYSKYLLLHTIRAWINRNQEVINNVEVVCKECKFPYPFKLPSQLEINNYIEKNHVFPTFCPNPNCRTQNNLSPFTFDVTTN